tara:strand:+ start:25983 stop:28160 length:2178 start_codon:yes stop_codon:yes gene_type:complete
MIRFFMAVMTSCFFLAACSNPENSYSSLPENPGPQNSREFQIPAAAPQEIRPSRPVTIADIVTLRTIGGMGGRGLSLSPDGRHVAFEAHQAYIDSNSYRVAWFVAAITPDAQAINVGDAGDPLLFQNPQGGWASMKAQWSADGEWIYYRRRTDGATQVWRSRRDGSAQQQVTTSAADVTGFRLDPAGRSLFFTTGAARARINAEKRRAAEEGYLVDDALFNPFYEARPFYPPYHFAGGTPRLWRQDLASGQVRKASDADRGAYEDLVRPTALPGRPAARNVVFSDKGASAAWLENADPEKYPGALPPLRLMAASFPDGAALDHVAATACPAPECRGAIVNVWWLDEKEVIFQKQEGYGRRAFYGWTPGAARVRPIYATTDWISDCAPAQDRVVCFVETPIVPRRIVSLNLRSGDLAVVLDPNPEFRQVRLGPVERLVWENEYGRKTWAYLVKPPAFDPAKRYPMIIVQYSPDECLRGGTGNEFPTHAFAANGFVVLCFSQTGVDPEIYRTLADPHAILRAEYGDFAKHKQSLSSLEAIIDRLAERGVIDPRRVGLTGLSAGVEILQYALIHSRAFAAAATSGGGSEPISYFGSTAFSRESFFHPLGFGNPFDKEQGKNWPQFSLALNTDKIDMPLLIQAADREYLHAIQTVITWNVAKKPIEMRVFPDEHHVKWYPAHRYNVHRRNVDWFNFWLRDVKDPDPTKAAQYERWEKLRRQHRNKEDPS